jgi:hypothetical protein
MTGPLVTPLGAVLDVALGVAVRIIDHVYPAQVVGWLASHFGQYRSSHFGQIS